MEAGICVIVTGPRASGKTRLLRKIIERLAGSGRRVRALIQPDEGRDPGGLALAFSLEFLSSEGGRLVAERIPLAREAKPGEAAPERAASHDHLALGRFIFERSAFARASEFISDSLQSGETVDVLGLDEIGRLELLRGEGLMPCLNLALAVAATGRPPLLLCSAREDCAAELAHRARSLGLETRLIALPLADEEFLALLADL
jgi:nucleoside-triphosphatase THEP1